MNIHTLRLSCPKCLHSWDDVIGDVGTKAVSMTGNVMLAALSALADELEKWKYDDKSDKQNMCIFIAVSHLRQAIKQVRECLKDD